MSQKTSFMIVSKRCKVCNNPRRGEIEQRVLAGEMLKDIAADFDFSAAALSRHTKNHFVRIPSLDAVKAEKLTPLKILENLDKIVSSLEKRIYRGGDLFSVGWATETVRRSLDRMLKLSEKVRESLQTTEIKDIADLLNRIERELARIEAGEITLEELKSAPTIERQTLDKTSQVLGRLERLAGVLQVALEKRPGSLKAQSIATENLSKLLNMVADLKIDLEKSKTKEVETSLKLSEIIEGLVRENAPEIE